MKILGLFDAICADILNGGGPDSTGYQREVLKAVPALIDTQAHHMVPGLARLGLNHKGVRFLIHQRHATGLYMNNQLVDLRGQHHVATAPQHHHPGKTCGRIGQRAKAQRGMQAQKGPGP